MVRYDTTEAEAAASRTAKKSYETKGQEKGKDHRARKPLDSTLNVPVPWKGDRARLASELLAERSATKSTKQRNPKHEKQNTRFCFASQSLYLDSKVNTCRDKR